MQWREQPPTRSGGGDDAPGKPQRILISFCAFLNASTNRNIFLFTPFIKQ